MKHTRMAAVAVVVLAVGLAACGGDDDVEPIEQPADDGTAAPPDEEEPTPDEPDDDEPDDGDEPDDPFAVPDDIDEPYAQSVIDELLDSSSEALRLAVEANGQASVPEDAASIAGQTHDGPRRADFLETLQDIVLAENIDEVYRPPEELGRERFDVRRVLQGSADCLVALGTYDVTETALDSTPTPAVFSLAPTGEDVDETANATPWRLYDGFSLLSDGEPASEEQLERVEYEDVNDLFEDTCGGVE
jgi:predicted small lipoprotein YifL